MKLTDATGAGRRNAWSHYPIYLIGAMVFVAIVNGYMVYDALSTFPGAAQNDGFDMSNAYNDVLTGVARQQALGWTVASDAAGGRPLVHLSDRDGSPLIGATVTAIAMRPLGDQHQTPLVFNGGTDGSYASDLVLPMPGNWDLMLRIVIGHDEIRVTRRVFVK